MSAWAQHERRALVDALTAAGPDGAVLPDDWRTRDLAAHVYVRENRLDALPGVVLPGLAAAYTDRVMASALRVHGYDEVVRRIADGPPLWLRPVDEIVNLLELFVHTEDVRRAGDASLRHLPPDLERLLWARLARSHRIWFRRVRDVAVELVSDRGSRIRSGSGPHVAVAGPPSELVLFAFDRKQAARVELTGDDVAVRRVQQARLGP